MSSVLKNSQTLVLKNSPIVPLKINKYGESFVIPVGNYEISVKTISELYLIARSLFFDDKLKGYSNNMLPLGYNHSIWLANQTKYLQQYLQELLYAAPKYMTKFLQFVAHPQNKPDLTQMQIVVAMEYSAHAAMICHIYLMHRVIMYGNYLSYKQPLTGYTFSIAASNIIVITADNPNGFEFNILDPETIPDDLSIFNGTLVVIDRKLPNCFILHIWVNQIIGKIDLDKMVCTV